MCATAMSDSDIGGELAMSDCEIASGARIGSGMAEGLNNNANAMRYGYKRYIGAMRYEPLDSGVDRTADGRSLCRVGGGEGDIRLCICDCDLQKCDIAINI